MKRLINRLASKISDRQALIGLKIIFIFLFSMWCIYSYRYDRAKEEIERLREQVRTYQIITETGRNGG